MLISHGRGRARSQTLQLLFQAEIVNSSIEDLLEEGIYALEDGPLDEYAITLAQTVDAHKDRIDEVLDEVSVNWSVSRMPIVDKNILRMAVAEMFYIDEIATSVAINEAVELSKVYAGDDSGKFINGVLGKIARDKMGHEIELDEESERLADEKPKRPDFIAEPVKEEE